MPGLGPSTQFTKVPEWYRARLLTVFLEVRVLPLVPIFEGAPGRYSFRIA